MEEENFIEKLEEEVDKNIKEISNIGIETNNIDFLSKVVDIKKDIVEIEKEENMRYRTMGNYGEYGRDSYGEYNDGSYGRRGVKGTGRGRYRGGRGSGRYRGQEMLDEMQYSYGEYSENREQYNDGNYGAKGDTMKSLEYMLESVVEFMEMLKQDATSQEEVELIKHYSKKISQM